MPLIDEEVLAEYQNDIGLEKAKTFLNIVTSEMETRSSNAFRAYGEGNLEEMEREFHTIKSICFMVGAVDMGNLAMDIELNARKKTSQELEQKMTTYLDIKKRTLERLNCHIVA